MASIKPYYTKEGKKLWKAQVSLGRDYSVNPPKKLKAVQQGFKTEREAKRWAREMEDKKDKGYIGDSNQLLKDFIMEWFNDVKKDTLSINARGNNLSRINHHIIPAIGDVKLKDLKTYTIQKFYNDMINVDGLAPASAKKVIETLTGCLKYAKKMKLIFDLPTTDLEKRPVQKPKVAFWRKEEAKYYLEQISEHYLYTPVLIALNTGLRVAEICGLRWSDLDLAKGTLKVTHQVIQDKETRQLIFTDKLKSNKSYRTITIPKILINHLKAIRSEINPKKNDFVILDRDGMMCNPRNISANFTGSIEKYRYPVEAYRTKIHNFTGFNHRNSHTYKGDIKKYVYTRGGYKNRIKNYMQLKQITFHDLRHTHATLLIYAGENIKVVSERLGHSNVKITLDTYFHVIEEMNINASNRLDDIFS